MLTIKYPEARIMTCLSLLASVPEGLDYVL